MNGNPIPLFDADWHQYRKENVQMTESTRPDAPQGESLAVSETTTNQRAACREDGSADSSKPNGSQDNPAAAPQTPRTDAFYECLGVIVDAEGVHDGLMKCRKHAEGLERQLAEALPSAIGEPRVEAEATHPENKVSAALMIACSSVPAEYGLLVNREFWNLLRGSNMKREKDDA